MSDDLTRRQSQIPPPKESKPVPEDNECTWCDATATMTHELKRGAKRMPSAEYIYSCDDHHDIAYRTVAGYI